MSVRSFILGTAAGLACSAVLTANVIEAYRDDLWPLLIQQRSVNAIALALLGDTPIVANGWMGQPCSAALCFGDGAIIANMRMVGPFDRDQIRMGDRVTFGGRAGIVIRGPVEMRAVEPRPQVGPR
ncbi:hypothetical protein ACFZ8E_24865 [Methylobacterium sp. HMF5984]|uniref:hypothetical protein n=1 Tax=Methylobacterium sp. HMF5984 TaxID=3367370 RepID=UPI0038540AC1